MSEREPDQLDALRGRIIVPHGADLPPPPPGVRYVRAPLIGIVIADDELRDRVRRRFHWPMIILALLVLPVLAIELFARPETWTLLWWLNSSALAIIWLAFLVEFVIKVSIAESRFEYCRHNWLDIIIILLPALRPLRLTYVAKTTRVFTLRGVGMKVVRYAFTFIIGLEATERMLERLGLKQSRDRKDPRQMTRRELMAEVRDLRRIRDGWEAWYDAEQKFLEERGFEPFREKTPPTEPPRRDPAALPDHASKAGRSSPDSGPQGPQIEMGPGGG